MLPNNVDVHNSQEGNTLLDYAEKHNQEAFQFMKNNYKEKIVSTITSCPSLIATSFPPPFSTPIQFPPPFTTPNSLHPSPSLPLLQAQMGMSKQPAATPSHAAVPGIPRITSKMLQSLVSGLMQGIDSRMKSNTKIAANAA